MVDTNSGKAGVSRRGLGRLSLATAAIAGTIGTSAQGHSNTVNNNDRLSADDRLDIIELHARYSWAYDCSDPEEAAATFTEDAVIDAFGAEAARGRAGIADLIRTLYGSERGDLDWQHHNGHFIFDGNGDACTVYNYWSLLKGNAATVEYSVRSFGYYRSECVKVDGEWLIARRSIDRWNRDKLPWK